VVINHLDGQQARGAGSWPHGAHRAGPARLCVASDVTRDADCVRVVRAATDTFGALHVLVNAAGISKMVAHDANARGLGRGLPAHLRRQHHRAVPDDPRRRRRR
jgi:NAD(P)-dependent dehydrogenase (short-subunit alcohol dehydrogenase family)